VALAEAAPEAGGGEGSERRRHRGLGGGGVVERSRVGAAACQGLTRITVWGHTSRLIKDQWSKII
jgi:hypothetical protein